MSIESPTLLFWLALFLKATLVLSLAAALAALLRRRSAALRHWVWALSLVSLLILPLLALMLPSWSLPCRLELGAQNSTRISPSEGRQAGSIGREARLRKGGAGQDGFSVFPRRGADEHRKEEPEPLPLGWILAGLWGAGAAIVAGARLIELAEIGRIIRCGRPISQADCDSALDSARRALGIRSHVRLVASAAVAFPVVWGVRRAVVALPDQAEHWQAERLQVTLLHELAHVKRRDCWWNLLAQAACVLYWFHPLAWLASARLRLESERASDDWVIVSGVRPHDYAETLLDIIRGATMRGRSLAAPAMAARQGLRSRLASILRRDAERLPPGRAGLTAFAALMALALVPLGAASLVPSPIPVPAHPDSRLDDRLIEDLAHPSSQVRKRAAWGLGAAESHPAVPALLQSLGDVDAEVRAMVYWALGEIKDRRAIQPLIAALEEPDDLAREMAVLALGELEDRRASSALAPLLSDPSPGVRSAVAWALGESKGCASRSDLGPTLRDPDFSVRAASAEVLGRKRCTGSLPELMTLLGDRSAAVRRESAQALGRIGDPAAVDRLIRLLRDPDPQVRAMAVWSLDEIESR